MERPPPNILFISLDQWRGDCLSALGHPVVQTPNLDALAADGTIFARHFAQSAPCAPARASLYTGLYAMTHRVVANGTPLDRRFETIAQAARRAGYAPALFGYTDTSIDPRDATGPDDPRLSSYEGVLPGFDAICDLPMERPGPWFDWLRAAGIELGIDPMAAYRGESDRSAHLSISQFLAGRFLDWQAGQRDPWFAHVSFLRPHPPYAAAGEFARRYDPTQLPEPIGGDAPADPLHANLLAHPRMAAPMDKAALTNLRAQYFGMVSEADAALGRIFDDLKARGVWDQTIIIVTADHGEYLGDHGLIEKGGYFAASYHIPCLIRDPRVGPGGRIVTRPTQAIDLFPTMLEMMGLPPSAQADGVSLMADLAGGTAEGAANAAFWEWDWRGGDLPKSGPGAGRNPALERQSLAVMWRPDAAYVQFADGRAIGFDLSADPNWRIQINDSGKLYELARAMLAWRAQFADRTQTGFLTIKGGIGRPPPGLPAQSG